MDFPLCSSSGDTQQFLPPNSNSGGSGSMISNHSNNNLDSNYATNNTSLGSQSTSNKQAQYGSFSPTVSAQTDYKRSGTSNEHLFVSSQIGFSPFQPNWNPRTRSFGSGRNTQSNMLFSPPLPAPLQPEVQPAFSQGQAPHPSLTRHASLGSYQKLDLAFSPNSNRLPADVPSPALTDTSLSTAQSNDSRARPDVGSAQQDREAQLRFELGLKIEQIEGLEVEIVTLKETISNLLRANQEGMHNSIPVNHFAIFKKLADELAFAKQKAKESEETLESVLVALSVNPVQSITHYGRYDAEDLAHKITVKLKILQEENDEMVKMLSYGRSKQKDIEIQLLKERIRELEIKEANSTEPK